MHHLPPVLQPIKRAGMALACALALGVGLAAPPAAAAGSSHGSSALRVTWMHGFNAPGTPARYNKVGVLKIGPADAKNVLVLEPGTSAGSRLLRSPGPMDRVPGPRWQVWSVERRENLLEDQSDLNLFKQGKVERHPAVRLLPRVHHRPSGQPPLPIDPQASVAFAKQWGMNVAVQDLHRVVEAAEKLGGKVVLGGHSLGGSVVTAYATWDFNGRAGATTWPASST